MRLWSCVLVCAMVLSSGPVRSQTKGNPGSVERAEQELLDLENRWLHAKEDPEVQEKILAPDFLHVLPGGIITRDEQLDFMRKHPASHGDVEKHFEDMHVRIYGIVGIVNGVVVRTGGAKTQRTLFTDVFAYRDGKWQAINAQELHPAEAPH